MVLFSSLSPLRWDDDVVFKNCEKGEQRNKVSLTTWELGVKTMMPVATYYLANIDLRRVLPKQNYKQAIAYMCTMAVRYCIPSSPGPSC